MDRKTFVAGVLAGLLAAPALRAQPSGRVFRIGHLIPAERTPAAQVAASAQTRAFSLRPEQQRDEALLAALRELGWVPGGNLIIENRWAGVDPRRQREAAAELKALPVLLIIALGTGPIRAARDGAPGVPIVMINSGDPVGAGFAASLARPGGDLTGTSAAGEEVLGKQLELLRAAVPELRRVGLLMNSANPARGFFFDAMAIRAKPLGLQLERIEVAEAGELDAAIARAKGGGMVVLNDPMFGQLRERIAESALRSRIPTVFGRRDYVVAGGLMSYVSSDAWHWRRAAGFIDKILKGARPGDLPIEQPTAFDLVINMKTARALGLALPESLLLRADEVVVE